MEQLRARALGKVERSLKQASPFGCMKRGKDNRTLVLGLDGSGKTAFLYMLKLGELVATIPTIGFNVETVQHHRTEFAIWDVGGQDKIRPLWRHYYQSTDLLVWVVSANDDADRLAESGQEFQKVIADIDMAQVPFLIVVSHGDLPGAKSNDAVLSAMHLSPQLVPAFLATNDGTAEEAGADSSTTSLCKGVIRPPSIPTMNNEPVLDAMCAALGIYVGSKKAKKQLTKVAESQPAADGAPPTTEEVMAQRRKQREEDALFKLEDGLCENASTAALSFLANIPQYRDPDSATPTVDLTPYSPEAVQFGSSIPANLTDGEEGRRYLPYEVVLLVTSYLETKDLLPTPMWHFTRGERAGGAFAVSRCFMYCSMRTAQFRCGPNGDGDGIDKVAATVFALQVPSDFLAQHLALLGMMVCRLNTSLLGVAQSQPNALHVGCHLRVVLQIHVMIEMLGNNFVTIGPLMEKMIDVTMGDGAVRDRDFLWGIFGTSMASIVAVEDEVARWLVTNIDELHPMGSLLVSTPEEERATTEEEDKDEAAMLNDIRLGTHGGPILDGLQIEIPALFGNAKTLRQTIETGNFFGLSIVDKGSKSLERLGQRVWFAALRLMSDPDCPCRRFNFELPELTDETIPVDVVVDAILNATPNVMEIIVRVPQATTVFKPLVDLFELEDYTGKEHPWTRVELATSGGLQLNRPDIHKL